jgi:hypothetical protein
MSPRRFLLRIPHWAKLGRVRSSGIWVSEDWLAEHRAREVVVGGRREVSTDLSTLLSERLSLVTDDGN